jgi:23S rRNA (uracil1939-C5)-methyltransferase
MSKAGADDEALLDIETLGAAGDGIARTPAGALFVPFALPGETVRVRTGPGDRATLLAVVDPSPDRVTPFCQHHGACGGCRLQHLAAPAYAAFKRDLVTAALGRRGLTLPGEPALIDAQGSGRRRITLHAAMEDGRPVAGFMRAMSHAIEPIDACPAAEPALAEAPAMARTLVTALRLRPGRRIDVQATTTAAGLDVDVRGAGKVSAALALALAETARRFGLARLTLDGEPVASFAEPVVTMGGARVALPPAAFLQATAAGEAALTGFAVEALSGAKRIADLFCGVGPFALRFAAAAAVDAFDSGPGAIAALSRAHAHTPGLKPLRAIVRDLFRSPVTARELAAFDAALFDPPRQGAEAQARQIAASGLSRVVAVSCDPGTFARDAQTLVSAGFTLDRLVAVDQFRWTAHVEIAALFSRPRKRGGRGA